MDCAGGIGDVSDGLCPGLKADRPARSEPVSLLHTGKNVVFASLNTHGRMDDERRMWEVCEDLRKYRVGFAALQETYQTKGVCENERGRFFWAGGVGGASEKREYGLGFFVSRPLVGLVHSVTTVSNRIALMEVLFKSNSKANTAKRLVLVNVYAPHSWLAREHPHLSDKFYMELSSVIMRLKKTRAIVMVMGDFNAKLGSRAGKEEAAAMGRYGRGTRNTNGELLSSFLHTNGLFAANTAFAKRMLHRTTWHGFLPSKDDESRLIRNQIDFIALPSYLKGLLRDATAHYNPNASDHSLLVVSVALRDYYRVSRRAHLQQSFRRNLDLLKGDAAVKQQYQSKLASALCHDDIVTYSSDSEKVSCGRVEEYSHATTVPLMAELSSDVSTSTTGREYLAVHDRHSRLVSAVKQVADEVVGHVPCSDKRPLTFFEDAVLKQLSLEQKELGMQLYNPPDGIRPVGERQSVLKQARNARIKAIKKRLSHLRKAALRAIATELSDQKSESRKFFAVQRMLWRKDPKKSDGGGLILKVQETDGNDGSMITTKEIHDSQSLMHELFKHYQTFFQPAEIGKPDSEPFPVEFGHQPLEQPVQLDEVEICLRKLRNNKVGGIDEIAAELLKYGGDAVAQELVLLFNEMFVQCEVIPQLCEGLLVPRNKPGKEKIAANTRPITLLTVIRKVLSGVLLHRMQDFIEVYVRHYQCGFRIGHGTGDIISAYRWLQSCAQRYQHDYHGLGIDLSKAFDTVFRRQLLEVLKQGLDSSSFRIAKVLLSNTILHVKVGGKYTENAFEAWMGTFQGDSVSPALFVIAFEAALREVEASFIPRGVFHTPGSYADDWDYVSSASEDITFLTDGGLTENLAKYNLRENPSKREFFTISHNVLQQEPVKKLGCMLDSRQDARHKMQTASAAFSRAWSIWRTAEMDTETRLKIFKACIHPHFLYNIGANALTRTQLKAIDSCHRRLLRLAINNHYPHLIGSKKLYEITNLRPISIQAVKARWKLFGHTLRQPNDSPVKMAILHYFSSATVTKKGPPATTIAQVLDHDIAQSELHGLPMRLLTIDDLLKFEVVALDRDRWRDEVVKVITKDYEHYLAVEADKHELQKQSQARVRQMKQYVHDGYLIPEYMMEEEWKESDAVLEAATLEHGELKHGRKRRTISVRGSYRHNRRLKASDIADDYVMLGQLLEHRSKKRTNNQDRTEDAVSSSYETNKRAFEEEEANELELDGAMDIVREEEGWSTADRKSTEESPNTSGGKAATMHSVPEVDITQLFEDLDSCRGDGMIVEDGKVEKKTRY